jgi:hypothetical protein
MYAIVYLFMFAGHYVMAFAREVYASLWTTPSTFTVVLVSYVLFQALSILLKHIENEVETTAIDTRLIIQGRLLTTEGRLSGIENKLDRIERALNETKPSRRSPTTAQRDARRGIYGDTSCKNGYFLEWHHNGANLGDGVAWKLVSVIYGRAASEGAAQFQQKRVSSGIQLFSQQGE